MTKWRENFLPEESFQSWQSYGRALKSTRRRFQERIFARADEKKEVEEVASRSKAVLKKELNWWDLLWFSIGAVVGAGIFVLTGQEANQTAGPAIVLSYAVAGFSAMLSVFCYTEFAVEIPAAGGSFSYLRVELGDFVAFIGAGNIVLEYLVAQAAVARSWTCYFSTLINKSCDDIVIHTSLPHNYNLLDPIAVSVLIITAAVAIYSTKAASYLNWISSFVNMAIILFVIIAGLANGNNDNLKPFVPLGSRSIFQAASVLYFAYIGFDAVATMAEETKNPSRDIPIGLLGSMSIITAIYCLMALTLTRMLPYTQIDPSAGFSSAFNQVAGWKWAKYVVALGALKGMTTVLLVGAVGQARYLTHIARTHLIPPWFSLINKKTQTPIHASVAMALGTCVIALFTELSVLANLLSISTLFIFMLVAIGILVRRYFNVGQSSRMELGMLVNFIFLIIASSTGLAAYYATTTGWHSLYILFIAVWLFGTVGLQFLPQVRKPRVWGVPLVPWLPSISIAFNVFLLGTIDSKSFIRFAVWTGIMLVYYFLFGLHASYDAAKELESLGAASSVEEGLKSPSAAPSAPASHDVELMKIRDTVHTGTEA